MAETVRGIFTADISGYTGAMSKLAKSTTTATNSVKGGMGKSSGSIIKFGALAGVGAKLATAGFDMVKRGVTSMASELSNSSATWKTFSQNMAGIGKSKKQIRSVKKELQDFAQKTIYSSSDMASTYSQLAAVGTKGTTKLVKGFGGLASAAENPTQAMKTLSQQATQMAAKPMVQWQDFKLMLEQTPAGIAAVAKTMHMSTGQLVKNVQDGKIATQDFFDAVAKTGTNKTFTNMAEQYKTVGQAMDGLRETLANKLQPAFDRVSAVAIKRISSIVDAVGNMNFDHLGDIAVTAFNAVSNATSIAYNAISSLVTWVSANKDWLMPLTIGILTFVGTFKVVETGIAIFNTLQMAMNVGRAVAGVVSGSQAAATALSMLSKESKLAASAQAALDAVMAINPWLLLATGIAAVVAGLTFFFMKTKTGQKIWSSFTSFLSSSWSKIKSLASSVWGQIGPFIASTWEQVSSVTKSVWSGVQSYLSSTWGKIKNVAKNVWTGITDIFTTAVSKVKGILGKFKDSFSIVDDALAKFGGAFGKVGGTVSLVVSALSKVAFVALGLTGPWGAAASAVLAFVSAWVKTGKLNADGITQVFDNLSSTITNVSNIIAEYLPKFVEAGTKIIVNLINGITQKIPDVVNAITRIINSLTQAISTALPQIITAGTQIIISLVNAIVTALPQIINVGIQIITSLLNAVVAALPMLINLGVEIITTLVVTIVNALPQIIAAGIQIITTLLNAIVTALPQIITAGIQIITTLINAIVTALPQIATAAIQIITSLVSTLVENLPQIIAAGVKILTALINGIVQVIPVLVSAAFKIMGALVKAIISNLPQIIAAGIKILLALVKGVLQLVGTLMQAGSKLTSSLQKTIISNAPKLLSAGLKLTMALVRGVLQLIGQLGSAGIKLISSFVRSLLQGIGKSVQAGVKNSKSVLSGIKSVSLISAGINLIKGFISGIKSMAGSVMSAASSLAHSAAAKIKSALKIHSPSRVTAEFGMYFGAGFVRGINGMQPAVERAAANLADVSTSAMDDLNGTMSPSMSVSRNLSDQFDTSFDDSSMAQMARMIVKAIDEKDTDLILDGDSVVKKTSGRMDNELGNNVRLRSRFS